MYEISRRQTHSEMDNTLTIVTPLSRRNRAGAILHRDERVELQIEAALMLDTSRLVARARITEESAPDFLREECLVYLIRDCHRSGDWQLGDILGEVVFRRCKKWINDRVRAALNPAYVDDCIGDVLLNLSEMILEQSDRGDFAQVRFWKFLKRLTIESIKKHLKVQRNDLKSCPIEEVDGEDGEGPSPPLQVSDRSVIPADHLMIYHEGLSQLKEPLRQAFILRHYYGWQIESNDHCEPSISRHFNVTAKTIGNWLRRAEKTLDDWRGKKI
jgi:DNA-directed RNA polymerase specialized sigma24 family protein